MAAFAMVMSRVSFWPGCVWMLVGNVVTVRGSWIWRFVVLVVHM